MSYGSVLNMDSIMHYFLHIFFFSEHLPVPLFYRSHFGNSVIDNSWKKFMVGHISQRYLVLLRRQFIRRPWGLEVMLNMLYQVLGNHCSLVQTLQFLTWFPSLPKVPLPLQCTSAQRLLKTCEVYIFLGRRRTQGLWLSSCF